MNYELAEARVKLRDPDYAQQMDGMLAPMFQTMEDRFLRLYPRAIVADLSKVSNDSHLNNRPKTFFETMGNVIENNVMASLFRLGKSANKYRKAMNNTI